jgi:hypothetical protein
MKELLMLRLLSALASLTILLGMAGVADAQCPPATIGVYAEPAGTTQSATPIQHQELFLYVIFFCGSSHRRSGMATGDDITPVSWTAGGTSRS